MEDLPGEATCPPLRYSDTAVPQLLPELDTAGMIPLSPASEGSLRVRAPPHGTARNLRGGDRSRRGLGRTTTGRLESTGFFRFETRTGLRTSAAVRVIGLAAGRTGRQRALLAPHRAIRLRGRLRLVRVAGHQQGSCHQTAGHNEGQDDALRDSHTRSPLLQRLLGPVPITATTYRSCSLLLTRAAPCSCQNGHSPYYPRAAVPASLLGIPAAAPGAQSPHSLWTFEFDAGSLRAVQGAPLPVPGLRPGVHDRCCATPAMFGVPPLGGSNSPDSL